MINNETMIEYEFPKFDPMTCTIDELTRHWKEYTQSEYIWNEVRDEIFQEGRKTAFEEISNTIEGMIYHKTDEYGADIVEMYKEIVDDLQEHIEELRKQ